MWTRKCLPKNSSDIMQPNIKAVRDFVLGYRKGKKRSLIIYGPTGCGKTASVFAIAKELGLELVEMNASDFRNADAISSIAGSASLQMSLFSKGKIILIDELDGIAGNEDRGGAAEIAAMAEKSCFPVIMTANDPFEKKLAQIRRNSLMIEYSPLTCQQIHAIMESICKTEMIVYDEAALKTLALRAGGDLRGAINDLEVLSRAAKKLSRKDVEELSERDREHSMSEAMLRIFKSTDIKLAITAFDNVSEDLEECRMWIDENLPSEYPNPEELDRAYNCLSKADIFNGRIRRSQHWRFLIYINALISAGVALSKKEKNRHTPKYVRPSRPLKIYIANSRNAKFKSIAQKVSERTGCSLKRVFRHYMPFMKLIFMKSRELSNLIAQELELEAEEAEWLRRGTP